MTDSLSDELPNLWSLYNLRESPYFQDTLGGDTDRHPLSLFVGREREVHRLLTAIGSSGSSRQVVGGAPGLGKTTLVQLVKARALAAGYWSTDRLVPFYPHDTAELVVGRIVGAIYDAILAARPHTADHPAMQIAQQLVRAMRLASGGLSLSVAGFGAGVNRGESVTVPTSALLVEGPRLVRELLSLVGSAGARGIVLHLNNLENLSDRDAANAADILRSLRDPVLLHHGLHVLVVGATDAVITVTATHAQLRSVFATPLVLDPLPTTDVAALLAARYAHLVLDATRPPVPPVAPETVDALYPLFRGDLRGLLKALEEGTTLLLGVANATPGTPISSDDLRIAVQRRYAAQLIATLDPVRARQLHAWAAVGPSTTQTQASLGQLWRLSQGAVSNALRELIRHGYVLALPRHSADPTTYVLAGPSRLIYG